jgi:hypothetical protein
VCEIFFSLLFLLFFPSCLGVKYILYYIYLYLYLYKCISFLIARSLSLDLIVSKVIWKRVMNCFLQFFPIPSLTVEQLQLQNPHIHIFPIHQSYC